MKNVVAKWISLVSGLSEIWVFKVIRKGFIYNMPLILIGSIILLALNLPVELFQMTMDDVFGQQWRTIFLYIYDGTLNTISVCVLVGITYAMIQDSKIIRERSYVFIPAVLVILGCYLMFVRDGDILLPQNQAESTGLFWAIVFSVVTTSLFIWFYSHRILKIKMEKYIDDNMMNEMIRFIEPAVLTFLTIAVSKYCINEVIGIGVNLDFLTKFMKETSDFFATVIFELITQVLWFFGVHGSNVLEPVAREVFDVNSNINTAMLAAGGQPTQMFTKQFLDVFVYLGGSGSSLCLVAALLIKGSKNSTKRLAKFSVLPALFNINEMIVFGLPIVFNLFFLVPFVLTPIVLTLITAVAMLTGFVPLTAYVQNWTTPIILGGYASTGSINGVILQLLNLCIGTLIYIPFVNYYENHKKKMNKEVLSELVDKIINDSDTPHTFIERRDNIGNLARSLANDISSIIDGEENIFYMEFQPQVSSDGKLHGAEALLRWNHEIYGFIPPPVIIKIAEESGLMNKLGNWIINTSMAEASKFNTKGLGDIIYSINLTARQIKDTKIINVIKSAIKDSNIVPQFVEFELSESAAFLQTKENYNVINKIVEIGSKLAIDDFGMGHSSLLYIKEFHVNTVKLDRVLVQDIESDVNCQEIVSTIVNLCNMLNLTLISEYVETKGQKEMLDKLGCRIYQGYYFSKSLKPEDFIEYALKMS